MKNLSLSFCLFILFSSLQAQQKMDFYYFGNKKVYMGQSTEKLYVRIKEGATETKTTSFRRDIKLPENAVDTFQSANFMVINLKDLDKSQQLRIVADFKKAGANIEISRPVLLAPGGNEVVIDEGFYVKLKQGTSYRQLKDLVVLKKCILNETPYKYDNTVYFLKAGIANHFDGLQIANEFFESGLFEYAEPDFRRLKGFDYSPDESQVENELIEHTGSDFKLPGKYTTPPNDPLFVYQWGAKNTGSAIQWNGTPGADISLLEAWDKTMGSPTIRIAVLDEGVEKSHEDLVNNILPIGYGLVAANENTGDILSTARIHGTACAGVIAAEANNGIGIAGIAPNCKLITVNLTVNEGGDFGTDAQIAQAIDWAWNVGEADVLSNSWGGGTASSLIKDAIQRAVTLGRSGKGSIVVFATGNSDAGLLSPAIFPEAIAVGSINMCYQRKSTVSCDGETTWGSSYGAGIDISAPGVKIASTRGMGTGGAPNKDYTLNFNGTSSAAPVVSGVAALVLSVNSNLTQSQVREILERTARKVGSYTYNFMQDEPNGSWSPELGHGMVNAKNAVDAAQDPAFCRVEVSAAGATQICSSETISLQVTNHINGDTYTWRKDGIIVGSGTTFVANQTGNYDVILNSLSNCRDTSYKIQVTVSPQEGALTADAGKDTTIVLSSKVFLGGGPAGSGGTAIVNSMRALVNDRENDLFIKFDPARPSVNFKIIKSDFNPDLENEKYYSGAASTPFGLYMMDISGMFVKIDTATGIAYPVNEIPNNLTINDMTYDPSTGKIFAVASATSNDLYEVDRLTGVCTLLATISASPNSVIISLGADNSGQLFGLQYIKSSGVASIIKINKSTGESTTVGNPGFKAMNPQGGDVDPLTDELYLVPISSPLGTNKFDGTGLWKMNKTTGAGGLVGSVAYPYNELDALSFANKEYTYHWSPSINLSNPNDANPQFTATSAGTFVYTLTVTDLCGNTATDMVTLKVQQVVPVTLLDFSGELKDKKVSLTWSVQNEVNFDHYQVERSTDGTSFNPIGSVPGRQSSLKANYNFDDQTLPASANIFYRLKMVDKDGKYGMSDVILLKNDANLKNNLIVIKPNPFTSTLTMQYESVMAGKLKGQIINSKGEAVKQFTSNIAPGMNEILIQGDNLPAGIYLLKVRIGDKIITRKIVKQ